jgi:hypothetical protein
MFDDPYNDEDQQTPGGLPYVDPRTLPPNPYGPGTGGYGPVIGGGGAAPGQAVNPRGGGGGGGGGGSFNYNDFPNYDFGPLPQFTAPQFSAPTLTDAQNEPGYQFRLQSGQNSLERSAAAKGLLRTGGTLKDIVDYGQNFASQEYGNVYNRALQNFDRLYRGRHDEFAPQLAGWQMSAQAQLQKALAQYGRGTVWNNPHAGGGGGGYAGPPDPEPQFGGDVSSFNKSELWPEF